MIKAAHLFMKNVRLHACQIYTYLLLHDIWVSIPLNRQSTEPTYLNFQDMTFEQSDKIKYLGVTLDINLNSKPHVKKLKAKNFI